VLKMSKNKIVIIGSSAIASFHVKALREIGLETIAVASLNYSSISEKKFSVENHIKTSYSNWKEMIDKEEYDGIVIASTIEPVIEVLEHAIQKNVPILVEKPVNFNSNNIKNFRKNAHDQIMVGYNRRFYKTVNNVKDFVFEENIPVIATMTVPEKPDIRTFFENSTHCMDMLRYIFGEIRLEFVKKLISEDQLKGIVATFSNDRKDIIQFIGNWGASDNFALSVYRNKKKLELKPFEELVIYDGMNVNEPSQTNPIRKYVPKLHEKINLEPIDYKFKPGFYLQSKAFADLIKNGINSDISATLFDAQRAIEICEELVGKYNNLVSEQEK
jgi:predicted dehydrogenase